MKYTCVDCQSEAHRERKHRQEGRPVVYVDAMYLCSSHTTPHEWTDGSAGEVHQIKMVN